MASFTLFGIFFKVFTGISASFGSVGLFVPSSVSTLNVWGHLGSSTPWLGFVLAEPGLKVGPKNPGVWTDLVLVVSPH